MNSSVEGIMAKVALNLFDLHDLRGGSRYCLPQRHVAAQRNRRAARAAGRFRRARQASARSLRAPCHRVREPELLGQGYRLITEELGKQDHLEIGAETVQTLLHDVDQRINDRKSTILYFSGLMVFLGLLGAFMGLMKTVHSVSELIGAMDVSGKGGSDSFGKMIEGMKAPLNGMSVGFSSSLFGLMTSMVLGALERCMTSAMKSLRNEFEHWLSNLAQLESDHRAKQQAIPFARFGAVRNALDAGVGELADLRARRSPDWRRELRRTRPRSPGLDRCGIAPLPVVSDLSDPRQLLRPVSDAVADLAHNQSAMLVQFRGLYEDAQEADRALSATLAALGTLVERSAVLDGDDHTASSTRSSRRRERRRAGITLTFANCLPLPSLGLRAHDGAPKTPKPLEINN